MKTAGFLKLDREILNDPFWRDTPFSKNAALVDLLLLANFGGGDVETKRGAVIHLEPGQLFTSYGFLAQRWGWSSNKVRRFLAEFQRRALGTADGTPNGTTLTVEKYGFFEDGRRAHGIANRQAGGIQKDKKKNEKSKEKALPTFIPPTVEEVRAYCNERGNSIDAEQFVDYYDAVGWLVGRGKPMKDWKAAVRTWEKRQREDRKDEEQRKIYDI